jgi:proteic killer suppression protein
MAAIAFDANSMLHYYWLAMIKSFADKQTQALFERHKHKRLPNDLQRRALRKLVQVDYAASLDDLRIPPNNHLEPLKGNRKGQYSIRINDQWRICFEWDGNDAHRVEVTDYHD